MYTFYVPSEFPVILCEMFRWFPRAFVPLDLLVYHSVLGWVLYEYNNEDNFLEYHNLPLAYLKNTVCEYDENKEESSYEHILGDFLYNNNTWYHLTPLTL